MQPTYWARIHVWNRIFTSDVYIWLDSVKFSRSATKWEDRTVVEASDGRPVVLRLPLKGSRLVLWSEAGVQPAWRQHLVTIRQCYSRRQHWAAVAQAVEAVYEHEAGTIDEVCWRTFQACLRLLAPDVRVVRSSDLDVHSAKGQLVLDLVKKVGGTSYVSGRPGMSYLPLERFRQEGVDVVMQEWKAPIARRGLANPSILDLLANAGPVVAREILSDARPAKAREILSEVSLEPNAV
jgi:WbqC-like protein family